MLIGEMTSTRDDQRRATYFFSQGERSVGQVSAKPLWRYHQQKQNTWCLHKPQRKPYSYEAYWLSLITLRNALQPYSKTINQRLHWQGTQSITRDQNILIFSIILFARR